MLKRISLLLLLSFLVTDGFADAEKSDKEKKKNDCLIVSRVTDITPIEERWVMAELRGGKRYFVQVEERCRGLINAVKFAINNPGNRLCSVNSGRLVFTERNDRGQSCRITAVEEATEYDDTRVRLFGKPDDDEGDEDSPADPDQ